MSEETKNTQQPVFVPTHILVRFTNCEKNTEGNMTVGEAVHSEKIQLIGTASRTATFRNEAGMEASLPVQRVFPVSSSNEFSETKESQIVLPLPESK